MATQAAAMLVLGGRFRPGEQDIVEGIITFRKASSCTLPIVRAAVRSFIQDR